MTRFFRTVLTIAVVLLVSVCCVFSQSVVEKSTGKYVGKTIILHSNDVHGAIEGYAQMAQLRSDFMNEGANVIVVDNGDFSQGTLYVNSTEGRNAVKMMNLAGYDIVCIGNHEFDFGVDNLKSEFDDAEFYVLNTNLFLEDGSPMFSGYKTIDISDEITLGFFALDTPETKTKTKPSLVAEIVIPAEEDLFALARKSVDYLRNDEGSDLVICVGHLGIDPSSFPNTSDNLMRNVDGIDFLIDGHSHSVFSGYEGLPMQQTGTRFAYIGVIIIDNATGAIEDYYLADCKEIAYDETVLAAAKEIEAEADTVLSEPFARTLVALNGERNPNRSGETNLGDLIADAMLWDILKDPSAIKVPKERIVAIENGGGIRASLAAGDITKLDVETVLPFINTLTVVYVSGHDLLEALEASTFCTPDTIGGFPQIAGMNITINTTVQYDANPEPYKGSSYHGPASLKRVTINDVNGQPFDMDAVYAVVTNDFCSLGGDTYFVLGSAADRFDTGFLINEVVQSYITDCLGGVIDEQYAQPKGRITIIK